MTSEPNPYAANPYQASSTYPNEYGYTTTQYPAATQTAPAPLARSQYAGWWRRVGAALIDGLISGVPYMILAIIGASMQNAVGIVIILIGWLYGVGFYFYQLRNQGITGQTIGKRAVGIRVISETTGQPIGFGQSFARLLCHLVDEMALYIGFLWPIWDRKKQTFADKIMHTVVVKAN